MKVRQPKNKNVAGRDCCTIVIDRLSCTSFTCLHDLSTESRIKRIYQKKIPDTVLKVINHCLI